MSPRREVVVVDGSNLATEGRSTPSLAQLEAAVAAFAEEHPKAQIVVVADATFEHRIPSEERRRFESLVEDGTIVTPPAGTVGRGDAFILRIAERASAVVLSNDSFQEFHGTHGFLFDDGRLIGGKPVKGVGWIFAPRNPVRGPKSRAARKAAAAPPEVAITPVPTPAVGAAKTSRRAAPVTKAPAKVAANKEKKSTPAQPAKRRGSTAAAVAPTPTDGKGATAKASAKAPSKRAPTTAGREPVNTPRAYQSFVEAHPLRSKVEGEVTTFTSHGAMITVPVGRRMHVLCYAPLSRLGRPAPTRARDVLKLRSTRTFRVAAFDAARRVPEVGLV